MKPDNLIKMANQIGDFFVAMPNREQAVKDVASHIQKNWDPRMRDALRQHIMNNGDAELMVIVREAMSLVK